MAVLLPLIDAGEVRDKAWLGRQPARTVGVYVAPKGDSGNDILSVAPGAGMTGGDCLLVESRTPQAGLPGLWVMIGRSNGKGSVANCAGNDGYLSRGEAVNRLSFRVRFERGFREQSAAKSDNNFVVGTYHHDPKKTGVRKETNNWHFYHQLVIRHDLAKDDWVHVVVNEIPQHQRGRSKYPPAPNPTRDAGNYWSLLTRVYLDCEPYFGLPEREYPLRMWLDDVQLQQVPVDSSVTIRIERPAKPVVAGQTTRMRVVATNATRQPVYGTIGHRSYYPYTPALVDVTTGKSVHNQRITLAPGETELELQLTPRMNVPAGHQLQHSVLFVPADQQRANSASLTDHRVCLSQSRGLAGPCDGSPANDVITLRTE
jgi:hypothetical protein